MAVRRRLFRELQPDEDVDDATPLDLLLQGFRVVFAPAAVAFDSPPSTPRDEIRARARMTVLGLTAILRRKTLLNPFRFPRPALALLSHRILRWLTPIFPFGAFLSSALLAGEPPYRVALELQGLFYALAVSGWAIGKRGSKFLVLRVPMSFCVWNIGFAAGLIKVLQGHTVTSYEPVWRRRLPAKRLFSLESDPEAPEPAEQLPDQCASWHRRRPAGEELLEVLSEGYPISEGTDELAVRGIILHPDWMEHIDLWMFSIDDPLVEAVVSLPSDGVGLGRGAWPRAPINTSSIAA